MAKGLVFLAVVLSVLFVLVLGQQLPGAVAAHFGPGGASDATIPRSVFVAVMALLAGAVPLKVWYVLTGLAASGRSGLRNEAYWFADARRERTIAWLRAHAAALCVATSAFLCYVFWLTVRGHLTTPPALPARAMLAGLGVYVAFGIAWLVARERRFRPDEPRGAARFEG